MATYQQLPSGSWRVQVRMAGLYRAKTLPTKRAAQTWAQAIELQAAHAAVSGFAPPPKGATLGDLIDKYRETIKPAGKTKRATLAMLQRQMGNVKLATLNALHLRDFIDRRLAEGAGGVTIAADLSFLSAVLKWARHARRIDINERLALEARASLKHRGINTRTRERTREPTDEELARLFDHWRANERMRLPMETLCRFALATGMRQEEIANLVLDDVEPVARTVVIRDRKDPQRKQGNDQTVPLLPDAWAIVAPIYAERQMGAMFPNVHAASVSAAFTRACSALGVVDLHFHDLRHKATADLFRMGLDIPRVALLTGHKTWTMLRRYTAIKPANVHAAIVPVRKAITRRALPALPAPKR